jgi:hypothetical protein
MSVNWKPSTEDAHTALPSKRHPRAKDPAWEEVMAEIERGNTVMIEYHNDKERGSLARTIGRRAAQHGITVDQRPGDGYISVRMVPESEQAEPAKGRKARGWKSGQDPTSQQ